MPVPALGPRDTGGAYAPCPGDLGRRVRTLPRWSELVTCGDLDLFLAPGVQTAVVTARLRRPDDPPAVGTLAWDVAAATPGLELRLDEGVDVLASVCEGWFYPGVEPVYTRAWAPVSGTVRLAVTEADAEGYAGAFSWTDLVFEDAEGARCAVPDLPARPVEGRVGERGGGGPR